MNTFPGSIPPALSRFAALVDPQLLDRLSGSRVLVAGMGAVGSFAVEALARCGLGELHLVDFDHIEPSNLNRQLYALHSTLGLPKTTIATQRVLDINPACRVVAHQKAVTADSLPGLLSPSLDLVVDAIDTPRDKLSLLFACLQKKLPVVSSMGAARRRDPGAVRTGRFADVHGCPLARSIRRGLRALGVAAEELSCVYSSEHPVKLHKNGPNRSIMGSSICVTGVFGLMLAQLAMQGLAEELN